MSTVLVVDDQDAVLRLACLLLRRAGFDVVSAGTADEAIAAAEQGPIDLVLSDLVMPERDGFELLDELRSRVPGLRAVMMTASFPDAYATRQDGTPVVAKPFRNDDLVAEVESALAG